MNRAHKKKGSQFDIKTTLTAEQKKLESGFIEYEKQRGIKYIDLLHSINVLFKYISLYNIGGLAELGVKGAQEFQSWLARLRMKQAVHIMRPCLLNRSSA